MTLAVKFLFVLLLSATTILPADESKEPFSEGVRLTIMQRQAKIIPYIDERVTVSIGDITAGQVLVEVFHKKVNSLNSMQRKTLLPRTSMRLGSVKKIKISGRTYFLQLEKLNNSLLGSDFAIFKLKRKKVVNKQDKYTI